MDSTQWTAKQSQLLAFLCPSSGLGSAYNMGLLRTAGMLAIGRSEIGEDWQVQVLSPMTVLLPTLWIELPSGSLLMPPKLTNFQLYPPELQPAEYLNASPIAHWSQWQWWKVCRASCGPSMQAQMLSIVSSKISTSRSVYRTVWVWGFPKHRIWKRQACLSRCAGTLHWLLYPNTWVQPSFSSHMYLTPWPSSFCSHSGKPGFRVTSRVLTVGLPFHQELDLDLNDRVCIGPWLFLYPLYIM